MAEDAVETVEMAFVLDQRGARQEIEFVDVEPRDPVAHRLHQRQELAQAGRYLRGAQFEEEGDEHPICSLKLDPSTGYRSFGKSSMDHSPRDSRSSRAVSAFTPASKVYISEI